MIGRPASAYGSAVAAARDASLRLRHHGQGRSPPARCARRRTPPSTPVPELREAPLHRLHLRRATRSSPPPSPPTGNVLSASDERADLLLLPFHAMGGSPSPSSRPGPASASAALDRAIGMALSPSSSSPLRRRPSTAAVPVVRREVHFPPPPSLPRGELSSASASITREGLDRAIRGLASQEALQGRRHCREAPSPPPSVPAAPLSIVLHRAGGSGPRHPRHGVAGGSPGPPSLP
nr:uncharacterized protein LOC127315239 [Lolium perenne]